METGRGTPDIALLAELSAVFGVDLEKLLTGLWVRTKRSLAICEKCSFMYALSAGI